MPHLIFCFETPSESFVNPENSACFENSWLNYRTAQNQRLLRNLMRWCHLCALVWHLCHIQRESWVLNAWSSLHRICHIQVNLGLLLGKFWGLFLLSSNQRDSTSSSLSRDIFAGVLRNWKMVIRGHQQRTIVEIYSW